MLSHYKPYSIYNVMNINYIGGVGVVWGLFAPKNDTYMWPLLLGLNKGYNNLITNELCGILGFVAELQK